MSLEALMNEMLPARQPVTAGEPVAVSKNVLAFPVNVPTQDVILNMILAGQSFDVIATALNQPRESIEKIASSEWATRVLETKISQSDRPDDILQNLMQVRAFKALMKLDELINCGNRAVELGATRTALEYSFVPAKDKLVNQNKKADIDKLESQVQLLQEEKHRLMGRSA